MEFSCTPANMKHQGALLISLALACSLVFSNSFGVDSDRRVFIWWQPEFGGTLIGVTAWSKAQGFTDLAISSYSLTAEQIDYIQSQGLKAWLVWIVSHDYVNYTTDTISARDYALAHGYDGMVVDDTQNIWYAAQKNGVDDLTYYQQFANNVSAHIVPSFTSDNVIVEMCIYSDNVDYNDMKSVDATDFIFSYYYPPYPEIKYFGNYYPNETGVKTNMTASAWNITGHYNDYGLNSYYKYQGWLWLEGDLSEKQVSNSSLIKTYNSVVDLANTYDVDDLMIYNVKNLMENSRLTSLLSKIIPAWKEDAYLSTNFTIPPYILIMPLLIGAVGVILVAFFIRRKVRDTKPTLRS